MKDMTDNSKNLKVWYLTAGALVVAGGAMWFALDMPPGEDQVSGTIAQADRYRTD